MGAGLYERNPLAEVRRLRCALLAGWPRTNHDQVVTTRPSTRRRRRCLAHLSGITHYLNLPWKFFTSVTNAFGSYFFGVSTVAKTLSRAAPAASFFVVALQ